MSPLKKIDWRKFGWLFVVVAVITVLWIIFKKVIANKINTGTASIRSTDRINLLEELKKALRANVLLRIFTWRKIDDDKKAKADSEKVIEDIFRKYSDK